MVQIDSPRFKMNELARHRRRAFRLGADRVRKLDIPKLAPHDLEVLRTVLSRRRR